MSHAPKSRWNAEDLALLRVLGGRMSQLILGEDIDVPDQQRRDELGILSNMVSRLARELRARRREQREQREELERRVGQLQAAYDTQEKLLATIRSLPSPILEIHPGILIAPIAGDVHTERVGYLLRALLERAASARVEAVIVHLAERQPATSDLAALVVRVDQSLRHVGARALLSGVLPPYPKELSPMMPSETLQEAMTIALDVVGYRITR